MGTVMVCVDDCPDVEAAWEAVKVAIGPYDRALNGVPYRVYETGSAEDYPMLRHLLKRGVVQPWTPSTAWTWRDIIGEQGRDPDTWGRELRWEHRTGRPYRVETANRHGRWSSWDWSARRMLLPKPGTDDDDLMQRLVIRTSGPRPVHRAGVDGAYGRVIDLPMMVSIERVRAGERYDRWHEQGPALVSAPETGPDVDMLRSGMGRDEYVGVRALATGLCDAFVNTDGEWVNAKVSGSQRAYETDFRNYLSGAVGSDVGRDVFVMMVEFE